ncbi:MAG: DUF1697 domain-containing protein, partial [Cytophagales bacterium]|nr:DUF1697 domain-containing protein [Cytophagales bacterium]
ETDFSILSNKIRSALNESHRFSPNIIILEFEELENAIASNPFPEAETEPKTLHLYFLEEIPRNPDLDALEKIKRENELFHLKDKVFYIHTPDGIGRSKLATRTEGLLGVAVTARNWRSVCKIMNMAKQDNSK